ncbi:MAG: SGNH/GDSL hydrolase family protein [Rhodopila sp.]
MSGLLKFWRMGSSAPSAKTAFNFNRPVKRILPRRRALAAFVLLSLAVGPSVGYAAEAQCPGGTVPPLNLSATAAAVAAGRPVTILALGSSSTAGVGASAPDKTYPAQLESMLRAGWPAGRVKVLNAGIGGQEADTEAARLHRDVLPSHPILVIWQAGSNAALRHMDQTLFRDALDKGLDALAATGADVVLMDSQVAPRIEREPDHAVYGAAMADAAAAHHDALFSRDALMRQWQAQGAEGMIGPDGLHQSDRGYVCVASALGKAILDAVTPREAQVGLHR